MKRTYEVKVKVEVSERQICDLLANGLADICGFDSIKPDPAGYKEAKASLIADGVNAESICREDVFTRMLFLNKKIELHDSEADEDEGWYELTLDNILKQNINWSDLKDNGDFLDNDAILQKACYGEVIYG